MCVVFLAINQHPEWPLLVAVNRDEWHDRSTHTVQWWNDPPLLAGRDERSGGTWLGATRHGRWGLVTNFRDPAAHRPQQGSRGRLVTQFVAGTESAASYCDTIVAQSSAYNGFNLLLAEQPTAVRYCSSRLGAHRLLAPGIYGLSNAHLDTPWPKVQRGKHMFRECLARRGESVLEAALAMLDDRTQPDVAALPHTGVGVEREQMLAPLCIVSSTYGTRNSSVLAFRPDGSGVWRSADRNPNGAISQIDSFVIAHS